MCVPWWGASQWLAVKGKGNKRVPTAFYLKDADHRRPFLEARNLFLCDARLLYLGCLADPGSISSRRDKYRPLKRDERLAAASARRTEATPFKGALKTKNPTSLCLKKKKKLAFGSLSRLHSSRERRFLAEKKNARNMEKLFQISRYSDVMVGWSDVVWASTTNTVISV